jgi:hypothetical protein
MVNKRLRVSRSVRDETVEKFADEPQNKFEQFKLYIAYDGRNDEFRYPTLCVYNGYGMNEETGYYWHSFDDPCRPGVSEVLSCSDRWVINDVFLSRGKLFNETYEDVTALRKESIIEHAKDAELTHSELTQMVNDCSLSELHFMHHNVESHGYTYDRHLVLSDGTGDEKYVWVDGPRPEKTDAEG